MFTRARVIGVVVASLVFGANAMADQRLVRKVVVDTAGDAVSVQGSRSRMVGFFEPRGAQLRVVMLVSGDGETGPAMRAGATLSDGQSYTLRLPGPIDQTAAEVFRVRRNGETVVMSYLVDNGPAEPKRLSRLSNQTAER